MILYSIVRVGSEKVAAVLVERKQFAEPGAAELIRDIEAYLGLPVMLVAADTNSYVGAQAKADFDTTAFLFELLRQSDIDWIEATI